MTFSTLGLSAPILQALDEQGYTSPTAIQREAIPIVLAGRDLLATAQTGTGKTASFVLPILETLTGDVERHAKRFRALVIVPTRELALQVEQSVVDYGKHLNLKSMVMVGGVDLEPQKQQLFEGVDILVATPGRLLDMAYQRALYFDELAVLVLDEADRMLDMGFIGDINKVIERLPDDRQNLLFSATMSDDVRFLASRAMTHPVELTIEVQASTQAKISQWLVAVDKDNKSSLLSHLIKEYQWTQALIFIRTKHGAAKLASQLEKRGINAEAIHSGRSQAVRTHLLADFKAGKIGILIATGIAARGLDIEGLARVVNYDLPDDADDYIHRIGRTGRAGASGEAVSLVSIDDFKRLCAIERRLEYVIDRKEIPEFTAVKVLPPSDLTFTNKQTDRSSTQNGNRNVIQNRVKPNRKKTVKDGQNKKNGYNGSSKTRKKTAKGSSSESSENWNPWLKKPGK